MQDGILPFFDEYLNGIFVKVNNFVNINLCNVHMLKKKWPYPDRNV